MVQDHFPFGAEFGNLKTLKNAKFGGAQRHNYKCYVGTIGCRLLLEYCGNLGMWLRGTTTELVVRMP